MFYADAHVEIFHHPIDLKDLEHPFSLNTQINASLINQVHPELFFLACYTVPSLFSWEKLLWLIQENLREIKKQKWQLVKSKKDLEKAGIKIILHVEDLSHIQEDLSKIDKLYDLGVRSIGLTHNLANQFAGGALEPDLGLTPLGKKAVLRIIQKGMLLDFAHLSPSAFRDALSFNLRPFISHAGIYSIYPNPRNISDEILSIIRKKDGFLGLGFAGSFLAKEKAGVLDVVSQIKYALKIVGDNRIGIGSDFGGIISFLPDGLATCLEIKNLAKKLKNKNIFGQNLVQFIFQIFPQP